MEYLPRFIIKLKSNVFEYTIHGSCRKNSSLNLSLHGPTSYEVTKMKGFLGPNLGVPSRK